MRLQGTDGIRGVVKRSADLKSDKCPLEFFLDSGILTEDFFELYAFGFARYLLESGQIQLGEAIAIGWDPRDREEIFTSRAVQGICKSGLNARVLGIVPTPLVPLAMAAWKIPAGMAITASHNPADQNGVKVFLTPRGLKPMPEEEDALSKAILGVDLRNLKSAKLMGKEIDSRAEGLRLFKDFHLHPQNSWNKTKDAFSSMRLVVDASNGACAGIAAEIFRAAGFREVLEVNADPAKGINENCGVVGFENVATIAKNPQGPLSKNEFIKTFFDKGSTHAKELRRGEESLIGAIFDGDGDRFYLSVYDAEKEEAVVLSGDEISVHLAKYLAASDPKRWGGTIFANTVESDLQASVTAAGAGFALEKTGVGDKWLLRKAAEAGDRFAVGAERSGHLLTPGYGVNKKNEAFLLFAGNGIKGALNAMASLHFLYGGLSPVERVEAIARPFPPGFNKNLYVYYTDKKKWRRDGAAWAGTRREVEERTRELFGSGTSVREKLFAEEPDLLFLEILEGESRLFASLHVRNSGTEDKTGITVKGAKEDADRLKSLGGEIFKILAAAIKDPSHPFCAAQNKLVGLLHPDRVVAKSDLPKDAFQGVSLDRLLREAGEKEGMLEETPTGYRLTDVGRWYEAGCKVA